MLFIQPTCGSIFRLTTTVNMLQWRIKTKLHRPTSRVNTFIIGKQIIVKLLTIMSIASTTIMIKKALSLSTSFLAFESEVFIVCMCCTIGMDFRPQESLQKSFGCDIKNGIRKRTGNETSYRIHTHFRRTLFLQILRGSWPLRKYIRINWNKVTKSPLSFLDVFPDPVCWPTLSSGCHFSAVQALIYIFKSLSNDFLE